MAPANFVTRNVTRIRRLAPANSFDSPLICICSCTFVFARLSIAAIGTYRSRVSIGATAVLLRDILVKFPDALARIAIFMGLRFGRIYQAMLITRCVALIMFWIIKKRLIFNPLRSFVECDSTSVFITEAP